MMRWCCCLFIASMVIKSKDFVIFSLVVCVWKMYRGVWILPCSFESLLKLFWNIIFTCTNMRVYPVQHIIYIYIYIYIYETVAFKRIYSTCATQCQIGTHYLPATSQTTTFGVFVLMPYSTSLKLNQGVNSLTAIVL